MPFTLFTGIFKPESGDPDGDSLHFMPHSLDQLRELPKQKKELQVSSTDTVNLRYEGIDTLEIDRHGKGEDQGCFAYKATSKNRELLGVPNRNDEAEGYILTRQLGSYGRPIAFLFTGKAPERNGSSVWLTVDWMKESVNLRLVEAGLAYPSFYDTLFADLRETIKSAAASAKSRMLGLWPHDQTTNGVTWDGKDSFSNLDPIFPKIWRRLKRYAKESPEADTLNTFIDFLRKGERDRLFIISESRCTDLDNIIKVKGSTIWLPYSPDDLIFIAKRNELCPPQNA